MSDGRADADEIRDALPSLRRLVESETDATCELRDAGDELRGDNPAHSTASTTGENFSVNAAKDEWFCLRQGHKGGGGKLEWIAVANGHADCTTVANTGIPRDVFPAVLEDAADIAGVDASVGGGSAPSAEEREERDALDATMKAAAEVYHKALDAHDMRAELRERYGLSDELIDADLIGYCPPGGIVRTADASENELLRAGLLDSSLGDWFDRWGDDGGRFVFPYWRKDKGERRARYFIGRAVELRGGMPKYAKLKTDREAVSDLVSEPPFGADTVRGAHRVILTEGVTDALALHDAGYASVSPVTTNIAEDSMTDFASALRGKEVVAVFDEDSESGAGLEGASRCSKGLWDENVDVEVARLPSDGAGDTDVNDYLRAHSADAFEHDVLGGMRFPALVAWWAWGGGQPWALFWAAVERIGRDPHVFKKVKDDDGEWRELSVQEVCGRAATVAQARRAFYGGGKSELSGTECNEAYLEVTWWYFHAHGEFFNASPNTYYFHDTEDRVYEAVDRTEKGGLTDEFRALAEERLGMTSAEVSRNVYDTLARRLARRSPEREAHRLGHWNDEKGELYVSDFNGHYFVLDGSDAPPERRDNGTDVFFLPEELSAPYDYLPESERVDPTGEVPGEQHPFVGSGDLIHRFLCNRVNYSEDANLGPMDQRKQLYLHMHALPFVDAFSSRPIMAFVGEKGSGKTMLMRSIGQLIYGPTWEESDLPETRKDFDTKVSNQTLAFIDNYDDGVKWANDALASVATGSALEMRILFSTNDLLHVKPKAFLGITSRSPPFRRDDVADRCLIFRVERLSGFIDDDVYLGAIQDNRDSLMSAYLDNLNAVVAERNSDRHDGYTSIHRMAGWAKHSKMVSDALGVGGVDELLEIQQTERAFFALEDHELRPVVEEWLADGGGGDEYAAADLLEEWERVSEKADLMFNYRKPNGLSKALSSHSEEMGELFGMVAHTTGRKNTFEFPGEGDDRTQYLLEMFGEPSAREFGPDRDGE